MCLVALAIDLNRRFPLIVAANRDEFFERPASRLSWWTPETGGPAILGGRDLQAGGTWMGLTAEGRFALVTNVRNAHRHDPNAPSRGRIVPEWLAARERVDQFWMRTALSGYNGFNLVAADFRLGECFWASNQAVPSPVRLERGLLGLSNASLDTPWPKVETLKLRLREAMACEPSVDTLALALFAALADRTLAPDDALPATGEPRERERQLSAAFIRTPDLSYGTRCSTIVIAERVARQTVTHVFERSFGPTGGVALMRRSLLKNWPPRYREEGAPSDQGPVSELSTHEDTVASVPSKQHRVRGLIKPDRIKLRRSEIAPR